MTEMEDNNTFKRSIYVKYFDVVNEKGSNLYVKCHLCGSSRKPISTAKSNVFNTAIDSLFKQSMRE